MCGWSVTVRALSLRFAAVEALSPGRGHMGQRRVRGDPAAEMCPAAESFGGGQWEGWTLKVGCPYLHGSKGHMWWHSVWLSPPYPAALCTWHWLHIVIPACTRVSAGATLPLSTVSLDVGKDVMVAVLWHGQLGRGTVQAALLSLRFLLSPGQCHAAH